MLCAHTNLGKPPHDHKNHNHPCVLMRTYLSRPKDGNQKLRPRRQPVEHIWRPLWSGKPDLSHADWDRVPLQKQNACRAKLEGQALLLLAIVSAGAVSVSRVDHVPGCYPGLHAVCQLLKVGVNLGQLCLDLYSICFPSDTASSNANIPVVEIVGCHRALDSSSSPAGNKCQSCIR